MTTAARVRIPPIDVLPRTVRVYDECWALARLVARAEGRIRPRNWRENRIRVDPTTRAYILSAALTRHRAALKMRARKLGVPREEIEAAFAALEMPRGANGKPLKPAAGALRTGAAPAQAQQDPPAHGPGFAGVLTKKARGKGLAW